MVKHKLSVLFEDGKVEVHSTARGDLVAQGMEEESLYKLSALLVHEDAAHSEERVQTKPRSFEDAKDVPECQATMKAGYDSMMWNNIWKLVDRPKKRKVIGTKWVYKLKF